MAAPYQTTNNGNSGLGRLIRSRRARAFDAVEMLLAQSPSIQDVQPDIVWSVVAAQGVDLRRQFSRERKSLYRRYLEYCFADGRLSAEETADLQHLRTTLHLGSEEVAKVHDAVAETVYGKAVEQALDDLRLDPGEEAFLRRLREELELPEADAEKIYTKGMWRARAMKVGVTRDHDAAEDRRPAGEFSGKSTTTIEDAVADALQKAKAALPDLDWFELIKIEGHANDGGVKDWLVMIRAGVSVEEVKLGK